MTFSEDIFKINIQEKSIFFCSPHIPETDLLRLRDESTLGQVKVSN